MTSCRGSSHVRRRPALPQAAAPLDHPEAWLATAAPPSLCPKQAAHQTARHGSAAARRSAASAASAARLDCRMPLLSGSGRAHRPPASPLGQPAPDTTRERATMPPRARQRQAPRRKRTSTTAAAHHIPAANAASQQRAAGVTRLAARTSVSSRLSGSRPRTEGCAACTSVADTSPVETGVPLKPCVRSKLSANACALWTARQARQR